MLQLKTQPMLSKTFAEWQKLIIEIYSFPLIWFVYLQIISVNIKIGQLSAIS